MIFFFLIIAPHLHLDLCLPSAINHIYQVAVSQAFHSLQSNGTRRGIFDRIPLKQRLLHQLEKGTDSAKSRITSLPPTTTTAKGSTPQSVPRFVHLETSFALNSVLWCARPRYFFAWHGEWLDCIIDLADLGHKDELIANAAAQLAALGINTAASGPEGECNPNGVLRASAMRRYGSQKWTGRTKTCPPKDAAVLGTLGRLPWEIVEEVLVLVVRAQGPLLLTGGRCASIPPRIGTGLLAANSFFYHRCRDFLYSENHFAFDSYGYALERVAKPVGRGIYCAESCTNHVKVPSFSSVQLVVGDNNVDELGIEKAIQFVQTLCNLSVPIEVNKLELSFANFCWSEEIGPVVFAGALKEKIKVRRSLEMSGNNLHWTFLMRAIPIQLGMKVQPVECEYSHHNDEDNQLGSFSCTYELAEKWNDRIGCDADGVQLELDDPRVRYIQHCAPEPFVPAKEPFRPARSYKFHLPAQSIRAAEDVFPDLLG